MKYKVTIIIIIIIIFIIIFIIIIIYVYIYMFIFRNTHDSHWYLRVVPQKKRWKGHHQVTQQTLRPFGSNKKHQKHPFLMGLVLKHPKGFENIYLLKL